MTTSHRSTLNWLLPGFAGVLLAPCGFAQLADMSRIAGSLGPTESVRLGDVTGDGLPDLVVLTDGDTQGQVGMFRAQTASSYGPLEILIPGAPGADRDILQLDDIDSDGDLDLWVGERVGQDGFLVGYLNDGSGTFSVALAYPGPRFILAIERHDIDGDGLLDLHVPAFFGAGFLRAMPDGSLLDPQPYFTAGASPDTSVLLDVDEDGDLDLLSMSALDPQSGQARTVLFDNTGTFPLDPMGGIAVDPLSPGQGGIQGDFDGDGDTDAVIYRTFLGQIDFFENVGGVLSPTETLVASFTTQPQFSMTDVTGDGKDDILWLDAGQMFYRENQSPFGFGPALDFGTSDYHPVQETDLNQDGLNDYLFLFSAPSTTQLYLRYGELVGGAPSIGEERLRFTDTTGRTDPVVFDPNGDGLDDLLLVENGRRLVWRRALGEGAYALSKDIRPVPQGTALTAAGDFDGDGLQDVVYVPAGMSELALLAGDGTGGFAASPSLTSLPSAPSSIHSADMDQDGIEDLVVVRAGGTAVGVLGGAPGGAWDPLINVAGNFGFPVTPVPIDANGDGRLDLAFAAGQVIELALQTPSGTFPNRSVVIDASPLLNGGSLSPVTAADIDGDGTTDLAFPLLNTVQWSRGLGAGAFGPLGELLGSVVTTGPNRLQFLRVDSDGREDLVLSAADAFQTIRPVWSRNLGGASFGPPQEVSGSVITGSLGPRSLVAADVDGDGDQDLISRTIRDSHIVTGNLANGDLGSSYCGPAVPNSTGSSATMSATGSASLDANQLRLTAADLPSGQFGFFVNSQTQGLVTTVPNSAGTLCLSGAIGRFNRMGEILLSGQAGTFSLDVDLTSIPTPSGEASVMPGQTWNFQAWFRDTNGMGGTTSNFTDGLEVGF